MSILNKESREDADVLVKLKDSIHQKMKKIKRMEESHFPEDSEDESDSSDEYDSFNDDGGSDEGEGELSADINSSDLESVDSQSDSESFKDIIHMLNNQFKIRMNRLLKYLKKKIEATDSEESEYDGKFPIESRLSGHNGDSSTKVEEDSVNIKEEICEKKRRRDAKAEDKIIDEEDDVSEVTENRLKKRFQKQKFSSVIGSYFYNKLRQGKSDSSQSPKSSESSIQIKQEEDAVSQDSIIIPSVEDKKTKNPMNSFELFLQRFN